MFYLLKILCYDIWMGNVMWSSEKQYFKTSEKTKHFTSNINKSLLLVFNIGSYSTRRWEHRKMSSLWNSVFMSTFQQSCNWDISWHLMMHLRHIVLFKEIGITYETNKGISSIIIECTIAVNVSRLWQTDYI